MRCALAAIVALLGGIGHAAPDAAGCALLTVRAVTGSTVYIDVLHGSELRLLAWDIRSATASRVRLDTAERLLNGQRGSGATAWIGTAAPARSIQLYRLNGAEKPKRDGMVHCAGEPAEISWTRDRGGTPWLIVLSNRNGSRVVEAFRRTTAGWVSKGIVEAPDLCTPRPAGRNAIACGAWLFYRSGAPHRIVGDGDLNIVPHGGPWERDTPPASSPEMIDKGGTSPVVRWLWHGRVHVATLQHRQWSAIADVPVDDVTDLSGPAVRVGNRLVFLALCYRTDSESFDAALIEDGDVTRRVVTVHE